LVRFSGEPFPAERGGGTALVGRVRARYEHEQEEQEHERGHEQDLETYTGLVDSVRIDRWLCAARIFKSRTLAQKACDAGHVRVGERAVRSSHALRVGEEIRAAAPRGPVVLVVLSLADKRQSPPKARELYEDHSPPPPPREERVAVRPRGAGRPTKAERRAIDRLKY